MIPILYGAEERSFTSEGLGRLTDWSGSKVTQERNGIFELEFQYPIDGRLFNELIEGRYVYTTHDESKIPQPFEIYHITKPINGLCTYYCEHISYKLRTAVVQPFTATSCADAIAKIVPNSINYNPFLFSTDKLVEGEFKLDTPKAVRSVLGGEEGSLLDVYGKGEYEWDKWNVKLWLNRGDDTDITIRYGKNLTDLKYDVNSQDSYTGIVPYWQTTGEQEVLVTLPEKYLIAPTVPLLESFLVNESGDEIVDENGNEFLLDYYQLKLIPYDMSSDFSEQPTVEELRAKAIEKLATMQTWQPAKTLEVNFVQLWQTEEYADYAPLERVKLCDTVSVEYPELGVTQTKVKVVKVVWDAINERYLSMELGEPKQSFSDVLTAKIQDDVKPITVSKTEMKTAISDATKLISGGYGGYVYWTFLPDGTPSELMFLDAPTPDTAVNVLRLNKNGIGFSNSGVNGLYTNAWTIDGHLNASTIFGGTLHIGGDTDSALEMDGENMIFNALVDVSEDDFEIYEYRKVAVMNTKNYGTDWVTEKGFSFQVTNDLDAYLEGGISEDALDLRHFFLERNFTELGSRDNPLLIRLINSVSIDGDLSVTGAKSREVDTDGYNGRLLYALETPSPTFSDIGECVLDDTGECLIYIDDIFSETVNTNIEYQVFLQKEGQGDCWVEEKEKTYFTIKGTPNLKVAWEIKAIQRGYEYQRLEETDGLYESIDRDMMDNLLESMSMYNDEFDTLIEEGEELLDETA